MRKMYPILTLSLLISFTFSLCGQSDIESMIEAQYLFNNKDYEEAISLLERIIEHNPFNSEAQYLLSYSYYYVEEYYKALEHIEKCYEFKELDLKYFQLKAYSYDELNKYHLAKKYLNDALLIDANNPFYLSRRASISMVQRNYNDAIVDYSLSIEKNPKSYGLYYNRGIAYHNIKKFDKACADWLYSKEHFRASEKMFHYKCSNVNPGILPEGNEIDNFHATPTYNNDRYGSFNHYIKSNLIYPGTDLFSETEGMAIFSFTVTPSGEIKDVFPLVSVSQQTDSLILQLINSSNGSWIPAEEKGQKTEYKLILPVLFKIQESNFKENQLLQIISNKESDVQLLQKTYAKILILNPFNHEMVQEYQNFLKKNNLTSEINLNWNKYIYRENTQLMDEVTIDSKYQKIYFDSTWQITNKTHASYYRISEFESSYHSYNGMFKDFTIDGNVVTTGMYKNGYKIDTFRFYHPNGNLYKEVVYKSDKPTGNFREYYSNGVLKHVVNLNEDVITITEAYDSLGTSLLINGEGKWSASFPDYSNTSIIRIEGSLKNFKQDKTWRFYINDVIQLDEYYENGKFKMGYFYDNQNKMSKSKKPTIKSWIFIPFSQQRIDALLFSNKLTPAKQELYEGNGYSRMHKSTRVVRFN